MVAAFPAGATELHQFVEWAVSEWRGRVRAKLSWMRDFPAAPSLEVITRQMEKLIAEWRGSATGGRGDEDARKRQRQRWGGRRG
jgi:hypothetical protein